jgi:hypothetical protein
MEVVQISTMMGHPPLTNEFQPYLEHDAVLATTSTSTPSPYGRLHSHSRQLNIIDSLLGLNTFSFT